MKGEAKKIIDIIVMARSKGDPAMMSIVRTKLILKGLNPSRFSADSDDDPLIIDKLKQAAREFEVAII
jgi:hypothetical protein